METQAAEIASGSEGAKVDSEATTDSTEASATSAAEAGAAKTSGDTAGNPEKKRDSVEERFDKLTRDLYELRGERDRERYDREARDTRIRELETQLETAKRSQVAPDTPPTLESVGYDEAKYQAATLDYLKKSLRDPLLQELRGELNKGEQHRNAMEAQRAWSARAKEFAKTTPDFAEKVEKATYLPISRELQAEIVQMEAGPQIAYYLADNREKAELIMKLPLQAQLRELGRIEGILEARKSAAKPPVSQAPPPPSKVGADSAAVHARVDTADSDSLTDAEWTRRRNAQEAARRRKAAS